MRKTLGFVLLICAYVMLVPGLTEPILTVSGTVEKAKLVDIGKEIFRESRDISGFVKNLVDPIIANLDASGTIPAFSKTNSILGTASELYNNNHIPVAALILAFSVGVPLLKVILLLGAHLPFRDAIKRKFLWLSAISSKWSMADVFVVAIFVAFLAANGLKESRALVDFESTLGQGFYYFLGYCLISILATQLLTGSVSWKDLNALAKTQDTKTAKNLSAAAKPTKTVSDKAKKKATKKSSPK